MSRLHRLGTTAGTHDWKSYKLMAKLTRIGTATRSPSLAFQIGKLECALVSGNASNRKMAG